MKRINLHFLTLTSASRNFSRQHVPRITCSHKFFSSKKDENDIKDLKGVFESLQIADIVSDKKTLVDTESSTAEIPQADTAKARASDKNETKQQQSSGQSSKSKEGYRTKLVTLMLL